MILSPARPMNVNPFKVCCTFIYLHNAMNERAEVSARSVRLFSLGPKNTHDLNS